MGLYDKMKMHHLVAGIFFSNHRLIHNLEELCAVSRLS